MKTALITGIAGQDGSFLAESLLADGYRVFGITPEGLPLGHIEKIKDNISIIYGDISDFESVLRAVDESRPDEIYNLAAMSSVADCWKKPAAAAECNALGPLNILEAMKRIKPSARFLQASTCEIFGNAYAAPQSEDTPFHPVSPYGIAKLYAHLMTENYRRTSGLFACSAIFFNHESERRGPNFVTRKITLAAANIKAGRQEHLELGNLDARRDWGYAPDYIMAARLVLGAEKPEDYVVASGESHSVREFCSAAFKTAGFKLEWEGSGVGEKGIDSDSGKILVQVNPEFFRPIDTNSYIGNPSKAEYNLGWKRSVSFEDMVAKMTEHDIAEVCR